MGQKFLGQILMDREGIAILNESSRLEVPGSVDVFPDVRTLEEYVEAVDVKSGRYHAITENGYLIRLTVSAGVSRVAAMVDRSHRRIDLVEVYTNHMIRNLPANKITSRLLSADNVNEKLLEIISIR